MADRSFEGNLGRVVTLRDLEQGVSVTDPVRVDAELRELFNNISGADPSVDGKDQNFAWRNIVIITPTAVDTELAVEHKLDRVPVAWKVIAAAKAGYHYLGSLYATKDADATYLYLGVRDSVHTNRRGVIQVY